MLDFSKYKNKNNNDWTRKNYKKEREKKENSMY